MTTGASRPSVEWRGVYFKYTTLTPSAPQGPRVSAPTPSVPRHDSGVAAARFPRREVKLQRSDHHRKLRSKLFDCRGRLYSTHDNTQAQSTGAVNMFRPRCEYLHLILISSTRLIYPTPRRYWSGAVTNAAKLAKCCEINTMQNCAQSCQLCNAHTSTLAWLDYISQKMWMTHLELYYTSKVWYWPLDFTVIEFMSHYKFSQCSQKKRIWQNTTRTLFANNGPKCRWTLQYCNCLKSVLDRLV